MPRPNDRLTARLSALTTAPALALHLAPARSRRGEPREPVYRFGRVMFGDSTVICCIIKDISRSGARIMMEGAGDLPEHLTFCIDQSGRRYRARVAWRRDQEAGLSLIAELPRAAGPVTLITRARV